MNAVLGAESRPGPRLPAARNAPCALPALGDDLHEIGRRLGFDLCRHSRLPACDGWPDAVREGFEHARSVGVPREAAGDLYVRKWLQLRLGALRRGRFVSAQVTPRFLARIDVPECPVLRVPLTRGELAGTDWSVDRLNNDAAYAHNNLAVPSTRANQAKGRRGFDEVLALSARAADSDGLAPAQWLRLAAVMLGPCFAQAPQRTPFIPSPVPLPNCTVRTAFQQVQHAFAGRAGRPAGKNALVKQFRAACRAEAARFRLERLADGVHEALKGLDYPWDVWLEPAVMQRLCDWRASLDDTAWGQVGHISHTVIGGRVIADQRLPEWRLSSQGFVAHD